MMVCMARMRAGTYTVHDICPILTRNALGLMLKNNCEDSPKKKCFPWRTRKMNDVREICYWWYKSAWYNGCTKSYTGTRCTLGWGWTILTNIIMVVKIFQIFSLCNMFLSWCKLGKWFTAKCSVMWIRHQFTYISFQRPYTIWTLQAYHFFLFQGFTCFVLSYKLW